MTLAFTAQQFPPRRRLPVPLSAPGGARRDREEKAQRERAEAEERAQRERVEARAAQRAKEGRLQLAMIHAVGKLTVGVAMALKRGHCNGEVEDGLEAVQKADTEYAAFLESVAVEHLTNERG